eukprot:2154867-Amphidinium_carterae.1
MSSMSSSNEACKPLRTETCPMKESNNEKGGAGLWHAWLLNARSKSLAMAAMLAHDITQQWEDIAL